MNCIRSESLRHLHCGANTFVGLLNTRIQTDVDAIVNVLILAQRWLVHSGCNFFAGIRRRIPVAQLFFAFGAHIWSEKAKKKNKLQLISLQLNDSNIVAREQSAIRNDSTFDRTTEWSTATKLSIWTNFRNLINSIVCSCNHSLINYHAELLFDQNKKKQLILCVMCAVARIAKFCVIVCAVVVAVEVDAPQHCDTRTHMPTCLHSAHYAVLSFSTHILGIEAMRNGSSNRTPIAHSFRPKRQFDRNWREPQTHIEWEKDWRKFRWLSNGSMFQRHCLPANLWDWHAVCSSRLQWWSNRNVDDVRECNSRTMKSLCLVCVCSQSVANCLRWIVDWCLKVTEHHPNVNLLRASQSPTYMPRERNKMLQHN